MIAVEYQVAVREFEESTVSCHKHHRAPSLGGIPGGEDADALTLMAAQSWEQIHREMGAVGEEQSCPVLREKRIRIDKACDACCRRKKRCDGQQPKCTRCTDAGIACTYKRVYGRRITPASGNPRRPRARGKGKRAAYGPDSDSDESEFEDTDWDSEYGGTPTLKPAEITPGTLPSPSTSQRSAVQPEPGVPAGMTSYFPLHTVGNDPTAFHLALERAHAMPQVSLGALLASNVLAAPSPRQPEIPIDTNIPNPPDPYMAPSSQFWFPPFGEMDPSLPGGIDPGYPGMHPGIAPEQFSGLLFPGLNVGHLPTPTLSSLPLGDPERGVRVQATPRTESQAQALTFQPPALAAALGGGIPIAGAGSNEHRQSTSFAQHEQFSHQFGLQPLPHTEGSSIPSFNTAQPQLSPAGGIPSSLKISSTANFYFGNNGYPFPLLSPSQLPQAGAGYGVEQQQQHQPQLVRNPSAAPAPSFSQFATGGGYGGCPQSHTQFDMKPAAPIMTTSLLTPGGGLYGSEPDHGAQLGRNASAGLTLSPSQLSPGVFSGEVQPQHQISPSQLSPGVYGSGLQSNTQIEKNTSGVPAMSPSQLTPGSGAYHGMQRNQTQFGNNLTLSPSQLTPGAYSCDAQTQSYFSRNVSSVPSISPSQYQSALLSRGLQTPSSASGQQSMWNGPPQQSYLAVAGAASARPPLPQRKVSDPELFMRQIQRAEDATWQGPSGGLVFRNQSADASGMTALSGVGAPASGPMKSPDEQRTTSLFQAASAPVSGVYLAGGARQFMGLNNGRPPALSASVADEAMMRDYFSALK